MATQDKSQSEVVPNITTLGAVERMSGFAKALQGRASVEDSEIDGQEVAANIAMKVLAAETVDDIFAIGEAGMPGGRDLVDVEQRINGISVRTGKDADKTNPLVGGTYLVVDAIRLSNGEPITWDTSATQLVTQLIALEQKNAFPIDVKIVDAGGKGALRLSKVAKRAI